MKTRLLRILILIFIAVVALLFLWQYLHEKPTPGLKIGVILAETGPADFIGDPEKEVLKVLAKQFKSESSSDPGIDELVMRDSAGKPEQALSLFQELEADPSVVAIIGPSTSGESLLIATESENLGSSIPILSLAASRQIVFKPTEDGREETRKWIFKFAQNDDIAAAKIVRAMTANKHKNVYLFYSEDGFGKSGASVFQEASGRTSTVDLLGSTPFPPQLQRPEALVAAIPKDIHAVVIWGTAPGPALLVNEIRRVAPELQIYLSHGNASESFIKSAGAACEGAIVVGSRVLLEGQKLDPSRPADQVVLNYRETWQNYISVGSPSHFGGHARDAFVLLAEILQGESARTREALRDRIEATENWPGVTGIFTFSPSDHAGLDERAFETYIISNGQFVPWRPLS